MQYATFCETNCLLKVGDKTVDRSLLNVPDSESTFFALYSIGSLREGFGLTVDFPYQSAQSKHGRAGAEVKMNGFFGLAPCSFFLLL